MDEHLKYVKQVLIIDACHRHLYGGTLYVAICYSANQDIYPVAVANTSRNESEEGWDYFLSHLKQACLTIAEDPDPSFIRGADVLGFETPNNNNYYNIEEMSTNNNNN